MKSIYLASDSIDSPWGKFAYSTSLESLSSFLDISNSYWSDKTFTDNLAIWNVFILHHLEANYWFVLLPGLFKICWLYLMHTSLSLPKWIGIKSFFLKKILSVTWTLMSKGSKWQHKKIQHQFFLKIFLGISMENRTCKIWIQSQPLYQLLHVFYINGEMWWNATKWCF